MLVVVITSVGGLEGELGPVSESKLWEHGSVLVVTALEVRVWQPYGSTLYKKPFLLVGDLRTKLFLTCTERAVYGKRSVCVLESRYSTNHLSPT